MSKVKERTALFKTRMSKFADQIKHNSDALTQKVAEIFYDDVIDGGPHSPGTPIEDGDARRSWGVAIGSLQAPEPAATPDDAKVRAFEVIKTARAGLKVYILNNAPHIRKLEFGSSEQAPSGMVRIPVARAKSIVQAAAEEVARGTQR